MVGKIVKIDGKEKMEDIEIEKKKYKIWKRERIIMIVSEINSGREKMIVNEENLGKNLKEKFGIEIGKRIINKKKWRLDEDGEGNWKKLLMKEWKMEGKFLLMKIEKKN